LVTIDWTTPTEIQKTTNYDKIHIYISTSENTDYSLLATINSKTGGLWITSYTDPTGDRGHFYIIRYYDSVALSETRFYLTWFELTVREQRLVDQIKLSLPALITDVLQDKDLRSGLYLALSLFNNQPPVTDYNTDNLPYSLEGIVVLGSQIACLIVRYLPVSIRDFNYSDYGLALTQDRGSKITNAINQCLGIYNAILIPAKMDLAYGGTGVGTLQLPISIGSNLNRGLLNVLDLFIAMGR
jgi:hypothetical protein